MVVDTSVWSLAFRRRTVAAPEADALAALLRKDDALMVGAVRQELLTGIREAERFRKLRDALRKVPDYPLGPEYYEVAAEASNTCRSSGVQGSNVDFLLCAISMLDRIPVLTTDADFTRFADLLPIQLFEVPKPKPK